MSEMTDECPGCRVFRQKVATLEAANEQLHVAQVERVSYGALRQQKLDEALARERKMRQALESVKARLDRNGLSGRQLPEYRLIEEALAQPQVVA